MTVLPLTDPIAQLVGRVALDHRRVPDVRLGRIGAGTFAGIDLAGNDHTLRVSRSGALRLTLHRLAFPPPARQDDDHWEGTESRPALEVALDRGTLSAQFVARTRVRVTQNPGEQYWSTRFRLHNWRWTTDQRPTIWVGVVRGADLLTCRNLDVIGTPLPAKKYAWGALFEGAGWRWFLVRLQSQHRREPSSSLLILDAASGDVAHRRLHRELRALRFCFGSSLDLGLLVGLNQELEVVAALGRPRARQRYGPRPPVPSSWAEGRSWQPECFRAVVSALEEPGRDTDPSYIAMETYLQTLGQLDIDSAYLQAQIALEAFCSGAVAKEKAPTLVRDPAKWAEWVSANQETIRGFAVDDHAATQLVRKVSSARHPPSSSAVIRYFERMGARLPPVHAAEVAHRGAVAHRYLMSRDDDDRDIQRDVERLTRLQTLLAGAVLAHCGYRGPIAAGLVGDERIDLWPPTPEHPPDPALRTIEARRDAASENSAD